MGISLEKGSSLSLAKQDGNSLARVVVGLGWDEAKRSFLSGGIDLDASAVLCDSSGNIVESVWYGALRSANYSVQHQGDNLTGAGDGDDEQISIDLTSVDPHVQSIIFTITSYSRHKLNKISNVFARVVDVDTSAELVRYDLADAGSRTAQIIAKVSRTNGGWEFTAIGEPADGRNVSDLFPVLGRFI